MKTRVIRCWNKSREQNKIIFLKDKTKVECYMNLMSWGKIGRSGMWIEYTFRRREANLSTVSIDRQGDGVL